MNDVIAAIEGADTKDQLEVVGKDALGVDVDKRKGIETIRAELAELAESKAQPQGGEQESGSKPEKEPDKEPDKKPAVRMLKHRRSGRRLPWTAQLAKKRDMREV